MKKARTPKTIAQVLSEVDSLDHKCKRISQVLGYRSSEIPKTYRQFITYCNSISIVFLQFSLHHEAFYVLSKAVQCDVSMFFEGSVEDRTWYGRALLYCNLGYLMLILNDIPSSLKFLYDAESLILEIKQMANEIDTNTEDLILSHATITFSILTKLGRLENAEKYLDIAVSQFNNIAKKKRLSKINKTGTSNLYCLLIPAVSIIKHHKEDKSVLASEVCQEVLKKVNDKELAASCLLEKYVRTAEMGIDMINSEEYRSILFITSCFPFIASNTPVIEFEELIAAQERNREVPINLLEFAGAVNIENDMYSVIMQEALNSVRFSH